MIHKHHIIPKHMGGTDEPSNLIELSVEEHAEAHKKLYEQFGRIEDYYAWQGLLGNIGKNDIFLGLMKSDQIRKKISSGVRKFWSTLSDEEKQKRKNQFSEIRKLSTGSTGKNWKLSEETKKKQRKPKSKMHRENLKLNHANFVGKNNPSYGTIWITNELETAKINKGDPIPEGWRKGRAFQQRKKKDLG